MRRQRRLLKTPNSTWSMDGTSEESTMIIASASSCCFHYSTSFNYIAFSPPTPFASCKVVPPDFFWMPIRYCHPRGGRERTNKLTDKMEILIGHSKGWLGFALLEIFCHSVGTRNVRVKESERTIKCFLLKTDRQAGRPSRPSYTALASY